MLEPVKFFDFIFEFSNGVTCLEFIGELLPIVIPPDTYIFIAQHSSGFRAGQSIFPATTEMQIIRSNLKQLAHVWWVKIMN